MQLLRTKYIGMGVFMLIHTNVRAHANMNLPVVYLWYLLASLEFFALTVSRVCAKYLISCDQ